LTDEKTRKGGETVTEYQIGKATVRIHGNCDPDNLKAATLKFLKQVEQQRKKARNEARKEPHKIPKEVPSTMEA
jgi:hypothetical protein